MRATINFRERLHPSIAVVIGVLGVAVVGILFAIFGTTAPTSPGHLVLSTDSNGVPVLFHISLANTKVRDGVFRAMNTVGLTFDTVAIGAGGPLTRIQKENITETLNALQRAGLDSTNTAYRAHLKPVTAFP